MVSVLQVGHVSLKSGSKNININELRKIVIKSVVNLPVGVFWNKF